MVNNLEPIAIIGSGCRFPGSSSTPSKLWQLLSQPRDVARQIPPERFNVNSFYHPDPAHHGTGNVTVSYFLDEDVTKFDAPFFNVKPMEAKTMDPQHRLLLETVYEAVEAAGLDIARLKGTNTAVYCGVMCGDYENILLRDIDNLARYHATGIGRSLMSNRISYFFDWKGPSITLDTACSSSLIAVHEAVQVLRSGRSKIAIAAGSNLLLGPENYIAESNLSMLSPNGQSRMWDANANGYARGEGVAAVVLKTLSQALADGDPIDCIVRNTGINQDGRTSGITMPSPTSQTELIRSTYREIGLDPLTSRPQYFEAHGTGTPAGDPVEAKAIHDAFFGDETLADDSEKLIVGSIKTVVGHTEGTAGLAALLKASLCLQAGKIAPNLLFDNLAPSVEPYYGHLEIPTALSEWPALRPGEPRRASVNSFGFGGANAHAILEVYEPDKSSASKRNKVAADVDKIAQPIVLSAASQPSLRSLASSYLQYLADKPSTDIPNLAWTLASRRTTHTFRISYAAANADELAKEISKSLKAEKFGVKARTRGSDGAPLQVLGVFTGQGAQWVGMGRELVTRSPIGSQIIDSLDRHLARLPALDRPSWTLRQELLVDEQASRISQAALSQPLCAAIQIMLVEVLQTAGLEFSAVVGHSSGEIGAAYAAGVISAEDAITIAYYRGLHSKHAQGRNAEKGSMLAVSNSLREAQELVADYDERISVAASNSDSSVTLSGDEEAINAVKSRLDSEGCFARVLKVDKAYHSHHMLPCAEPYGSALARTTSSTVGKAKCPWYSSVHIGELGHDAIVKRATGQYWVDNMVQPVLFSQAVQAAAHESGPFDLVIEVGPHPALRTPVLQTLGKSAGAYFGTLSRESDALAALSSSLGSAWSHLGPLVNLPNYIETMMAGDKKLTVSTGLPTYAWDHEASYWHESRRSRLLRLSGGSYHELLGRLCPEVTSRQISWRNFLDPKEIPWLDGHQLQGQSVFPAAGYVVMAIEASRAIAERRGKQLRLVEVEDVSILQAVTVGENDGVETLLSLTELEVDDRSMSAVFSLFTSSGNQSDSMALVADGRVKTTLTEGGEEDSHIRLLHPSVEHDGKSLTRLDASEFYEYLDSLGYGYSGQFRILSDIERCLDSARSTLVVDDSDKTYIVHPAVLDCAFQTAILAFSAPYDGGLWSLHVPTSIKKVVVDAQLAREASRIDVTAELDKEDEAPICGDLDLCSTGEAIVQVEQIRCVPFARATEANDTLLFSETVWNVEKPDVGKVVYDGQPTEYEHELAVVAERACYYYLRLLDHEIPRDHPARTEGPYVGMFEYTGYILSRVAADDHLYVKKEWDSDSWEDIERICEPYKDTVDIRMVHAAGQNFRNVVWGKTTMLEHMRKDGLLDRYYEKALAFPQYNKYIGRAVAQLSHRFPNMNILEVGAGTGSATKTILKDLKGVYSSYTFTDISSGFFPTAEEVFTDDLDKMIFKTLDIGRSGKDQGFSEQSYDLIVASFVLHATEKLEQTMRNARRLLKPGGYIMMLEVTDNEPIREGSVFGCLPGWWLGRDDGRIYSPCIDVVEWDQLLRKTGFGGVDAVTPKLDPLAHPVSLIVSQAVDDRIQCLREPLTAPSTLRDPLRSCDLLIAGGKSLPVVKLARSISDTMRGRCRRTTIAKSLETISLDSLGPQTLVLCLVDLDNPVFSDLTEKRWSSLKRMFEECKRVLWVTQGRLAENPHANISLGFGRTQLLEAIGLTCQFVDLDSVQSSTATLLSELLARLAYSAQWTADGIANDSNLLWTLEQEAIFKDGAILLPRLKRSPRLNDRYNSSRRPISIDVPASKVTLGVQDGYSIGFSEATTDPVQPVELTADASEDEEEYVELCVDFSIATPLKLVPDSAPLFVASGHIQDEPTSTITTLSPVQASNLRLPRSLVVPSSPSSNSAEDLRAVAGGLVATTVLRPLKSGQSLLVYNADATQAEILSFYAKQKSVTVTFAATQGLAALPHDCIEIPPHATSRALRRLLPERVDFFVDLSHKLDSDALPEQLLLPLLGKRAATLPSPFRFVSGGEQSIDSLKMTPQQSNHLGTLLRAGLVHSSVASKVSRSAEKPVVSLRSLQTDGESPLDQPLSVVDWRSGEDCNVQVPVLPADSRVQFRGDRTYWLQGLSGSLGLSLCHWMITKGAKHVVLSSRNPKIDDKWLQRMKRLGGNVVVLSCDITSKASVKEVYDQICSAMPPIAGVTQGAMVLDDGVIQNMSYENVMTTLRPKVDGSIHLEQVLLDTPLDFFIFFSSGAFVTGRMGQANYTAANAFMVSMARRRRSKGLAGSVLHLGPVVGVGYVERIDRQAVRDGLIKTGYNFMSESDFHVAFSEAVLASPADSDNDIEVTTCVRSFSKDDVEKPVWCDNPRMSHLGVQRAAASQSTDAKLHDSVKSQLLECTSNASVHRVVQDAFVQKLKGSLQLVLEGDAVATRGLDSVGVDSLIAVEIRAWFSQTLGINVPVLKILSGVTVVDLVKLAMTEMPPGLTPKLTGSNTDKDGDYAVDQSPASSTPTRNIASGPDRDDGDYETSSDNTSSPDSPGVSSTDHITKSNLSFPSPTITTPEEPDQPDLSSSKQLGHVGAREAQKSSVSNIIRSEPLCYGQAMFWFTKTFLDDPTTLNHAALCRITGPLRIDDLSRAVWAVANRHESLRTCFIQDEDGEPLQGIMEESLMELHVEEVRTEADAWAALDQMMAHVYDLERGNLMNAKLLRLADDPTTNFLLVGSHHINFDGFSSTILVRHYQLAYAGVPLPWDILQYPDLGRQQARDLKEGKWNDKMSFWKQKFNRLPPALPLLPMARVVSRGALEKYEHHRRDIRLDARSCSAVKASCRRLRCTPFHFYLAAFRLLLTRLCDNDDDMCIGIAEANRNGSETADCLGPLMGLLPLLFKSSSGVTNFAQLVRDTKETALEALFNGGVPFELLLQELQVPRSRNHSPLFQAFVDYRMGTQEKLAFDDCELEILRLEPGRSAYDVSIDIIDNGNSGSGDCLVSVMAQKSLYDEAATDLLASCYRHLVQGLSKESSGPLENVQHFPPSSLSKALEFGWGELRDSEWNTTLPERIMCTARKYPHKIAIKDGYGNVLSYEALAERVVAISEALEPLVKSPRPTIAVYQEPSADWVCSMIAIMNIGAIYVPLDMGTPVSRLSQIVQDCKPELLLVGSHTVESAKTELLPSSPETAAMLVVEKIPSRRPGRGGRNMNTIAAQTSEIENAYALPCAILYTSGSTGVPKGIVLTHGNIANEVEQSAYTYGFGPDDVILQQSALSFDMSLTQIFSAVAFGGTLCMVSLALRGDAVAITAAMVRENVTFTGATPSEYTTWLAYGHLRLSRCPWRIAVAGGEPIKASLLERFRALDNKRLRLFNAYGPTEVTCSATRMELDYLNPKSSLHTDKVVSAGRPAPNSFVYLVDEKKTTSLQAVPVGVSGEIVVAGAGVVQGYLNRRDLTEARFVPGTYFSDVCRAKGWSLMHHRTGDRGRWLADGTLLIEGRTAGHDTRVKLGGMRIDLGDIEAVIAHAGEGFIAETAVTLHRPSGLDNGTSSCAADEQSGFLVAYVVLQPQATLDLERFRTAQVAPRLPLRMIPAAIFPVDRLPTTVSGKLDRRAIAELDMTTLAADNTGNGAGAAGFLSNDAVNPLMDDITSTALSPDESKMLDLWAAAIPSDLIRSGRVSVLPGTDFFHVGGNSLLLIKLQASIRKTYGVKIPLVELFEHSSLKKMVLRTQRGKNTDTTSSFVDWEAEAEVAVDWASQEAKRSKSKNHEPTVVRQVVMTGASGFLGAKLLENLVARQDIETVYCVAVRNPGKLTAATAAAQSPKVSIFPGDLTQRRLGLSVTDAETIFGAADAVLHNGCDVSHMRSYTSLKPSNYDSTREIVRLAMPHRIPVHYVSSAEVAIYSGEADFPPRSAAPFPPPSGDDISSADGYTACKWVSERFLEKVCRVVPGLCVSIYRPTSIVRGATAVDIDAILGAACSGDNDVDGPARDLWQELFYFSTRVRAVPTSSVIRGVVNFVSAENVVDGILDGVLGRSLDGDDTKSLQQPRYVNLGGCVELPIDEWQKRLEEQIGAEVEAVSLEVWAARAEEAGLNPTLAQFFAHVESMGGLVFPKILS
ncbi:putative Beta-ketoacyl synthase domain-containing protein [Seiridium cardinale]|uniref:Beta-ketoacyl synthase domain-containing protein n=1 Tax=Seiridium cardinale TaxID=138064 RepID=A0ABR2XYV5_9PEZI